MARQAHARLTFLVDPDTKRRFEEACAAQDIRPSQLMRHMIKAHIAAAEARAGRAGDSHRTDWHPAPDP